MKRFKHVMIFNLVFPICLILLNFIVGVLVETDGFDIVAIFTEPIYYRNGFTFVESILDFDKFLGEFMKSTLFSIALAGLLVTFGRTKKDYGVEKKVYKDLLKRCYLFGSLAIGLVIFCLLGSILNLGLAQPQLDGQTFSLLGHYYPENFAESLIIYLVIICCGALPYVIARISRGSNEDLKDWQPKQESVHYLILFMVIFELLLLFSVIRAEFLFSDYFVQESIYTILEIIFISGIVLAIEYHQIKRSKLIAEQFAEGMDVDDLLKQDENTELNEEKRETPKETELKEDSQEESPGKEEVTPLLKVQVQRDPIRKPILKYEKWYVLLFCGYLFGILFVAILGVTTNSFLSLSLFGLLQRSMIVLYRVFCVLFLYHLMYYTIQMNEMEVEMQNE